MRPQPPGSTALRPRYRRSRRGAIFADIRDEAEVAASAVIIPRPRRAPRSCRWPRSLPSGDARPGSRRSGTPAPALPCRRRRRRDRRSPGTGSPTAESPACRYVKALAKKLKCTPLGIWKQRIEGRERPAAAEKARQADAAVAPHHGERVRGSCCCRRCRAPHRCRCGCARGAGCDEVRRFEHDLLRAERLAAIAVRDRRCASSR